jgi:monoamine oxidase
MRTIVVGAGIAGLWIAEQLALRGDQVTVLEKTDRVGGRIETSTIGLEIGAGRIATSHTHVRKLARRFNLALFPIPDGGLWKAVGDAHSQPNTFDETWSPILENIATLDHQILATHTLRELAVKTLGPAFTENLLIQFGFRAETEVLRADLGVRAFRHEMGAASFMVMRGGLSQLITGLAAAAEKAGVTIRLKTKVIDISPTYDVQTVEGTLSADRVILALPSVAVAKLPCMRTFTPLRHLQMEPLTRIYAKFATPWCLKQRLVTDSPLRFIIPVLPEFGLVMISYTESQDTQRFKGLSGLALIEALTYELLRLFPEEGMPVILWAAAYEWPHGCTYWLPGTYDPAVESAAALQPFPKTQPHLHLCNESFSLRQAWIEGSLEHAAALLSLIKEH